MRASGRSRLFFMKRKESITVLNAEHSPYSHKRNGTAVRPSFTAPHIMPNPIPAAISDVDIISSLPLAPSVSIEIPNPAVTRHGTRNIAEISRPKSDAPIALEMNFPLRSISVNDADSFFPSANIISLAARPHHSGGMTMQRRITNSADMMSCSGELPLNRSIGLILPKYSMMQYRAASPVRRKSSVPMGRMQTRSSSLL